MTHPLKRNASVMPAYDCPVCGTENDRASAYNTKASPRIGDLAICFKCGAINKYGEGFRLELVPDAEVLKPGYTEARRAQAEVRKHLGLPVKE